VDFQKNYFGVFNAEIAMGCSQKFWVRVCIKTKRRVAALCAATRLLVLRPNKTDYSYITWRDRDRTNELNAYTRI
jgi:hypothetical protein